MPANVAASLSSMGADQHSSSPCTGQDLPSAVMLHLPAIADSGASSATYSCLLPRLSMALSLPIIL